MSDTKRVFTQAVVHFKKSVWSSLSAVGSAAIFAVALYTSQKNPWLVLLFSLPLLYGLADLLWSLAHPLLSIASWNIVHRPLFWRGATTISRAEITAWRLENKHLVIERAHRKPVKVKLDLLSKKNRQLALMVLRERGYGDLET